MNSGCIVWETLDCYEEQMYEMIELKYGKKFLERIRNEAMEIYKPRRKEIIDEYHKEIEGGYVIVDSMPEYPEGIPELYKYVSLEMDKAGITEYKNAGKFFIQFVVDLMEQQPVLNR